MNKISFTLHLTVACAILLLCSSLAQAQAGRTWVSGVGDNANPCTRTAPCKTFAAAISKTAPGGEINVLDPGDFGPVTINISVTIDASGSFAGITPPAGLDAITVNAGAFDVVVLRGLTLEGANLSGLNGIRFTSGGALHVENCTINNFGDKGIFFNPSTGGAKLFVKDTIIRGATGGANSATMGGGILIRPASTARASIEATRVEGNLFGIRAESGALVTIKDMISAGNLITGFVIDSSSGSAVEMNIEHSASTSNRFGIRAVGSQAIIRISEVTVTNNLLNGLVAVGGGTIVSFGNNRIAGNNPDGAPSLPASQQ